MLKKSLVIGGAAALLCSLFGWTTMKSYFATGWHKASEAVADAESVGFKLDRARTMIKDLDPEIRHNMHLIAKEEVEVEGLRERLAEIERKLAKDKKDIDRLNGDLQRGASNFVYVGVSYSKDQVETDLRRRFDRFKEQDATAEKLRQILEARKKGLAAADSKLQAMKAAKSQLEVQVENLQARVEMVAVANTASNIKVDDSQLGKTRELLNDISARIAVAEKLVNVKDVGHEIPLDEPASANILEEVAKYFGKDKPNAENVVKLD